MWQYNYNELYHYGVPGMKWGHKRAASSDSVAAKNIRKKKVKEMSNQELRDVNKRMNLEQQHRDLAKKSSKGRAAVKGFIATAGTLAAVSTAVAIYAKHGKKAYKSLDKVKKISTVMINAKKSGVATGTIARAAKEAFKMNYLK